VHRLKRDFPQLTIALNGGLADDAAIADALVHVDGAMIGRHAYHEPWALASWDTRFFAAATPAPEREAVEEAYVAYMARQQSAGTPWAHAARHMLGLYNGLPGARRWRQVWSDHRLKGEAPQRVMHMAREARVGAARVMPVPS